MQIFYYFVIPKRLVNTMSFPFFRLYKFALLALFPVLAGGFGQAQQFQNFSEVRSEDGKVNLYINGDKVPPFAYMSYLGEGHYYKEMANAGVETFCLLAYLGDQGINSSSGIKPFRDNFWKGMGEYNFSVIQDEFEELVKVKPDAKVIVRVHLDAPMWWGDQNPNEMCRLPDGSTLRVSFSSLKWREDAGVAMKALLDWVRKSKFNENLIGVHVAGGFTEEWFFHYKNHFYDESAARLSDFRKWLREKYDQDEKKLRDAWGNQGLFFDSAVPSDISGATRQSGLRKIGEDVALDDTFDYHAQVMSGHIAYFAKLVKEASANRLLTGAFYGYHLFVHDPRRGHGSLATLLESPYLDYLSSPNDYRRISGIDWPPMAAVRSVQLHGKLWMAENDTRTSSTTLLRERAPQLVPENNDGYYDAPVWKGPKDPQVSRELLWKNAARMLAYGYGGWWFDMWGGWFSDPIFQDVIRRLRDAYEAYEMDEEAPQKIGYRPEVALVVDEKLQFRDSEYGGITVKLLTNRYALGNSGTPFDVFLKSDLPLLKGNAYKVVWYLGLGDLSEEERKHVEEIKRNTPISVETDENGSAVYQKARKFGEQKGRVQWTPEELREIYTRAGVHVFSRSNDVVYAGNGWFAVHFSSAGKKEIQLPGKWLLIDVKEDSEPHIASRMELEVEGGETIVFRVEE